MRVGGGPPTHAVGFTLLNSGGSVGEEIRVYDTGGALIGRQTAVPANVDSVFIGITSNQPIGWVEFDEDAGGDEHRDSRPADGLRRVALATRPRSRGGESRYQSEHDARGSFVADFAEEPNAKSADKRFKRAFWVR